MTLPETLLTAYDLFLQDEKDEHNGECVETAHDKHFFYEVPEYKGGEFSKRTDKVYEPWFSYIHGERSELPDAIKEAPKQPN
jgi:hypothetical protein